MKRILFVVNHEIVIYNFRKEMVQYFINLGYQVFISCPNGPKLERLKDIGASIIESPMNPDSMNVFNLIHSFFHLRKVMKKQSITDVLTFTIKPNIFGGLAAFSLRIPYYVNITGLGKVFYKRLLRIILYIPYSISLSHAKVVFVQNTSNKERVEKTFKLNNTFLLPGSGVNLNEYTYHVLPKKPLTFLYMSRIMTAKGIYEYLEAAKIIKEKHPEIRFIVIGMTSGKYPLLIKSYQDSNIIEYLGFVDNVKSVLKDVHAVIHPTFYEEGLSNILLEAGAMGRILLSTNRPGTKEVIQEGITGFFVQPKNAESIVSVIEKMASLTEESLSKMSITTSNYIRSHYDRSLVNEAYHDAISD